MCTACGCRKVHVVFVYRRCVQLQPQVPHPEVDVVRSARRRRTVSAYRDGDRIVVRLPARMTRAEEQQWVDRMVRRVLAGERRRLRSDDDLLARAARLSATYLDGAARPAAVRWVDNQLRRWAAATSRWRSSTR